MYIAFDRRQQHFATNGDVACFRLLRFHIGQQVSDRLFHHPGALHHLGKKHLPGAEEVADDVHAVHERPLDDRQRVRIFRARLFQIGLEVIDDSLDQSVGQPRFDRSGPPGFFLFRCCR